MSDIEIIKAGIQTTVQDLGRTGSRHLGITLSGAADNMSLSLANRLVGNPIHAAGLEIVIGPVQIRFRRDTWFALCGADFGAKLDQQVIPICWRIFAREGQILSLGGALSEARAYLAFDGGIAVDSVLGSCATDLGAGFGGWHGRALQRGDILPLGPSHHFKKTLGIQQRLWTPEIRAIPGPEYHGFSVTAQKHFWTHAWRVSSQSNRMGYRLQGHVLECCNQQELKELRSHAVLPGVVQVPPNGQPIVLLADAQTTGGYPRFATVIEADLWKVAQTPIGQHFCFQQCSLEDARHAYRKWQQELHRLDWIVQDEA